TPVLIGGFDLYSGLSDGSSIISSGKLQTFEEATGVWNDVAGSSFVGNTEGARRVMLPSPVESARFRLVVNDLGSVIIREFVPLPVEPGAAWPAGVGVTFSDVLDYRELDDLFYTLEPSGSGLSLTSTTTGDVSTQAEPLLLTQTHRQHYQVLLDVGTDTYRIRNRVSGLCLSLDSISLAAGTPVVEAEYLGMPHQRWRRVLDGSGRSQFVNAYSGLAIEVDGLGTGATLTQQVSSAAEPLQWFDLVGRDHFPKKGVGGWPFRAEEFRVNWAYNWGKIGTDFPENVDYWPMQWGSFFWDSWPELVPSWKRDGDPYMLMGYNEPDAESQSNVPVPSAVAMWPRNEVVNAPLLGPAPVGPTNQWILDFMQGVADNEMRVEYAAVHRYPGPNADGFINSLEDTYNTFGLDLIVSEFSVVDWNDTNSWNDDQVYNFFAEVFWRMEKLDYVKRFAIFVFTDDPSDPISDNRGEMFNADGTLTPEGKLFAAWDGDTVIRTDTPYHLHNEGNFKRPGAVVTGSGPASIVLGDRTDDGADFQWVLEPVAQSGRVVIRSVLDGRLLAAAGSALELVSSDTTGSSVEFEYVEAEHGWFHIDHPGSTQRLRLTGAGVFELSSQSNSGDWTRWRFTPVFEGHPAAPRGVSASSLTQGDVFVAWQPHGFRDIQSFAVYRTDSDGSTVLLTDDIYAESFIDTVPAPGTYIYEVTAIGDTGESVQAASMPVSVETCPADFNGDFTATPQDVVDLLVAVQAGLDYNADGVSNFFDALSFLDVYEAGCLP
ncbi:MAG: glycosyl hydrolase, partial [Planctomycetota bacterium]